MGCKSRPVCFFIARRGLREREAEGRPYSLIEKFAVVYYILKAVL
jgi:hypothetical protein